MTTSTETESSPQTVTAEQLARLLDLQSTRRVQQLVKDEGMPKDARGRYNAQKCVLWYIRYLHRLLDRVGPRASNEPTALDTARERKEVAAARKLELEAERLDGSSMPIAEHEARLSERCEELAGRVKGLGRWVPLIRGAATDVEADAIADQMEDELMAALRGAADEIPDDVGPDGNGTRAHAA
jgi:hypothetical protein